MGVRDYKITGNEAPLTEKEKGTLSTLIRLGDSKELALKTIYAQERARPETSGMYRYACEC
jgi:hypothetical protein